MKNASFTPWGKRSVFLLKNIFSATGMEEIAGLEEKISNIVENI